MPQTSARTRQLAQRGLALRRRAILDLEQQLHNFALLGLLHAQLLLIDVLRQERRWGCVSKGAGRQVLAQALAENGQAGRQAGVPPLSNPHSNRPPPPPTLPRPAPPPPPSGAHVRSAVRHAGGQHTEQRCASGGGARRAAHAAHLEQLAKVLLVLWLHLRQALQLLGHIVRLIAAGEQNDRWAETQW